MDRRRGEKRLDGKEATRTHTHTQALGRATYSSTQLLLEWWRVVVLWLSAGRDVGWSDRPRVGRCLAVQTKVCVEMGCGASSGADAAPAAAGSSLLPDVDTDGKATVRRSTAHDALRSA